MRQSTDVIILGLGAMGSAAAYELASRGVKVLGFERHTPAHNLGSSHGGSRMIRQAYNEHPSYVPLVMRAYELWRELEKADDARLLFVTGGIHVGAPDSTLLKGSQQSAALHRLPHELLGAAAIERRFPMLHPAETEVGLFEYNAGYLRPELAVSSFLRQASSRGAELHFNQPVLGWKALPSGEVQVTTSRGSYHARRLIIAPGAWAPEFFTEVGLPLTIRRHVLAWFHPPVGIKPFLATHFPVYAWQSDPTHLFYGFPAIDGPDGGVKVAMHTGGMLSPSPAIDRTVHDEDLAEIRDQIASRIPGLNGPLVHATTCMYTMTPDEHFVLGLHPRHPQVAIACGFSGHGFKFASVVGEILADLATSGHTRHSIDFLSPRRFLSGSQTA